MNLRDYIIRSIQIDKRRIKTYQGSASKYPHYRLKCGLRKNSGYIEYSLFDKRTGKTKYLGIKDYKLISELQRKKLAEELIKNIKSNIKCKEAFCERLLPDSVSDVVDGLPFAYRPNKKFEDALIKRALISKGKSRIIQSENPYKREELKEITSFGLVVRSKGELAIAELLYSMGIEFFYEKALTIRVKRSENGVEYWVNKTYYPDFTIVLRDGRYIYWEHEGLLSNQEYNESNFRKMIDYSMNEIYISHNLILTAEGDNNQMDMDGIKRIIEGWLMPMLGW